MGAPNLFFCCYVLPYHGSVNPEIFSSLYRKTKILNFDTLGAIRALLGAPTPNIVVSMFFPFTGLQILKFLALYIEKQKFKKILTL